MVARILDVTPEQYLELPHFSASRAKVIIAQSEMHARKHRSKPPNTALDRGGALHTMVLGKGKRVACLPFNDWRKDAAKESRDKARAAGMIPTTHVEYTEYETAAKAIKERFAEVGHALTGQSEVAIEWEEQSSAGPVLCRCMIDHLDLEMGFVDELKIVDDAHPDRSERTAESLGYGIACAAYIRAVSALRPDLVGHISFRFLFCEPAEPYAIYLPEPDERFIDGGERKWLRAVEKWGRAQATGIYPGYQDRLHISRPTWALRQEGYAINE